MMTADAIIYKARETYDPKKFVLMVSGGHDSVVNAHVCATILKDWGINFEVYHGDTTIGIPETQEYVKMICEKFGWKLKIRTPPNRNLWYDRLVEKHGFPGPTKTSHQYMYRYLKERALRKFVTYECKSGPYTRENIALLTGIRQDESIIRMGYNETVTKSDSIIWVSPIFYWTEKMCDDYMRSFNIPRNPVKEKICISGECLCGCFAKREEWIEIKKSYPHVAMMLEELQVKASANGHCWAWGDYITQNHWMASKKVLFTEEGWFACMIHCILYSVPFLFIASFDAFMVIFITHFLIDKFRLAKYIVQVRNWCFTDTGAPIAQPPFLAIWLLIIADNTLHLTINFLAIKHL